jgi:hypothetical protein
MTQRTPSGVAETRRPAGLGLIVVALSLAVIATIWIVACALTDTVVNPTRGANAFLYGGAGACFLCAVAALFLVPMWLRRQPWIGAAITLCFGISFFGAFVSLLGAYALSNTN